MLTSRLTTFLKKQSFQPNLLSIFINPFYIIRKGLARDITALSGGLSGRMMDFGCGRKPYKNLIRVNEYIGVDIETTGHDHSLSEVDVYYDGKTIPLPAGHFDSIFCSEVIEHIFNPDEILSELNRVLRPGGKMLVTVPFCWNEHEIPYDYGRYSSFGIKALLKKHGFEVTTFRKNGNFVRVMFQLWILYLTQYFQKMGKIGKIISLLFVAPINLLCVLFAPVFPVNQSLYFNNVLIATKPETEGIKAA